jgi:NAD/NADP transhydrogenase beta subunit
MAVAKAQYAISEITAMLRSKDINVRVRSFFKRLMKIVLYV